MLGCKKEEPKQRESEAPIDVIIPDTQEGEIEEKDYKKIPSYLYSKMTTYSSYQSVTKGQTLSDFLGSKITQSIDATAIKGEYSYMKNESKGMVNTVHEAYYKNQKAVYRDKNSGDFSKSSIEDYLNIYGTYPFDTSIEGYLINEDSIKSVEKISHENSTYIFKVIFDEEKSTNNVKIQMKKFGGLDEYPVFSLIEMTFTFSEDFTLKTIDLHSKYKAKKIFSTDCEQTYTVTYSRYNEAIELPDLDSVKDLFN